MEKTQFINIEVPAHVWKEFGITAMKLNQTRKESMKQALLMFNTLNKTTNEE